METVFMILKYLPVLINAITAVEQIVPAGGQGAEKLDFVKGVMQATYDGGKKFEDVWPQFDKTIALAVNFLKKTGVFK